MNCLRQDSVSGRWVIISEERARRPDEFSARAVRRSEAECPFCPGRESLTPAELAVYPPAAGAAWQVRVIPNKYPALRADAGQDAGGKPAPSPLFPAAPPYGVHEVLVESPLHVASLSEITREQAEWTCLCYRDRLVELARDPRLRYALVFKNVGAAGGASLEHTHSQVLATPIVPPDVERELDRSLAYWRRQGACLLSDLLAEELQCGERIAAESPSFVAFCPYASRFPFEVWVLPRRPSARFEAAEDAQLAELGRFLRDLIGRIERAAGRPAYNYVIHTAPFDSTPYDHYHWHVEVLPRVTMAAGFEQGAGCYVNPLPPEEAAARLRAA